MQLIWKKDAGTLNLSATYFQEKTQMQIWIFLLARDKIIWSFTPHGQFMFNCAHSVASEAKTIGNEKKLFLISTMED